MKTPKNIDVLFVPVLGQSSAIRRQPQVICVALALPFKEDTNGYLYTGGLDGVKHFALWVAGAGG